MELGSNSIRFWWWHDPMFNAIGSARQQNSILLKEEINQPNSILSSTGSRANFNGFCCQQGSTQVGFLGQNPILFGARDSRTVIQPCKTSMEKQIKCQSKGKLKLHAQQAATLSYKKKKRSKAASTYLQKLKSSLMKLTSTSRLETKFQNIK